MEASLTFRYPNELLIFTAPPGYGAAPYMAAPYGAMPPPPQYGAPPAWGKLFAFYRRFSTSSTLTGAPAAPRPGAPY